MLHGFYSWDEWVQENRVLKFNDSNVQRQKELAKQYSAKNKKGLYTFFFFRNVVVYVFHNLFLLYSASIEAKETRHAYSIQR